MKKAKALENISVRYFAVHLNRSHDPKRKSTPCGCFFRFARRARFAPRVLPGYESDERSSLGECGCALPVADEAQSHECAACPRLRRARQVCLWQTLRVAEVKRASARADRCGHRNRDMFAHTFRVTPTTMLCIQFGCQPEKPQMPRGFWVFLYPFFTVRF